MCLTQGGLRACHARWHVHGNGKPRNEGFDLRFLERDLRVKVTAILLLLVIIALASAGLVSYSIAMRIVKSSIDESMLDSARLSRSLLQVALERRQSRQSLLAGYPVLRDPNASLASKGEVMKLFVETWPIGSGAILLDTGGNPIAGTGNLAGIGNASQTAWFKNAWPVSLIFTLSIALYMSSMPVNETR